MTGVYLLVAVLLLLANAFFVAAEVAVIAAAGRRSAIEELAGQGRLSARWARASVRELSFALTGAQLGITMASLGLGFVAEPAIADVLAAALGSVTPVPEAARHGIAAVVALSLVVFLHMVVGEMAPKNVAIAEPIRTALWVAIPFRLYSNLFRGVLWALNALANQTVRLLGVTPRDELLTSYTPSQIRTMLAALQQIGAIDPSNRQLASRALQFSSRHISEVMLPRSAVVAMPAASTALDVEQRALATGHSRFPVYVDGPDDVRGFVHVKDLLTVEQTDAGEPLPQSMIRPLPVVPESAEVGTVLLEMQRRRSHISLAVDEHGSFAGIVTMEDLLEELVGEIRDEHDVAELTVQRVGPGRFLVAGQVRRDELRDATGCDLPEVESSTVGGFLMERLGAVPTVGQTVELDGWRLRVRRMDGPRVDQVDVIDAGGGRESGQGSSG